MDHDEIGRRHGFAHDIARRAGVIARHHFRSAGLRATGKGAHDWVTQADLEIDSFLSKAIADAFPQDGVLTEESGGAIADTLWVIDPIDGTTNFSRGLAHFAISIAFHAGGRTQSGIVFNPITGEMFSARRGGGAWCNGTALHVRDTPGPGDAIVDAGYSLQRPLEDYVALVGRLLQAGFAFLQNGSAAMGLAQVAAGRIDGYCELHLNSWDVLAGLLLVEEAGGHASDFTAGGGLLNGNSVLGCTLPVRDELRALLR